MKTHPSHRSGGPRAVPARSGTENEQTPRGPTPKPIRRAASRDGSRSAAPDASQPGYLLIEVLIYIGVIVALLGTGYAAMYRCIDSSIALRRNAEDIANALHAGERWRADVRSARQPVRLEDTADGQLLYLPRATNEVAYRFATNAISRRLGAGPWVRLLPNVKSSAMKPDPRQHATAWCWELELAPRTKGSVKPGHVRPLFTFIAVPERPATK